MKIQRLANIPRPIACILLSCFILCSGCQSSSPKNEEGTEPEKQANAQETKLPEITQTASIKKPLEESRPPALNDNGSSGVEFVDGAMNQLNLDGLNHLSQQKKQEVKNKSSIHFTPESEMKTAFTKDHIDQLIENQKEDLTLDGITRKSTAADVAETFVRNLAKRNSIVAERLLTVEARVMTSRAGLQLSPVASQKAKYVIGKTSFATKRRKVAYVDIHVHDPDQGSDADFVVTWALRKTADKYWKVSGMRTDDNGIPRMINFENLQHVTAIVQSYSGSPTINTADLKSDDDKMGSERYASEVEKQIRR